MVTQRIVAMKAHFSTLSNKNKKNNICMLNVQKELQTSIGIKGSCTVMVGLRACLTHTHTYAYNHMHHSSIHIHTQNFMNMKENI